MSKYPGYSGIDDKRQSEFLLMLSLLLFRWECARAVCEQFLSKERRLRQALCEQCASNVRALCEQFLSTVEGHKLGRLRPPSSDTDSDSLPVWALRDDQLEFEFNICIKHKYNKTVYGAGKHPVEVGHTRSYMVHKWYNSLQLAQFLAYRSSPEQAIVVQELLPVLVQDCLSKLYL